jgi:hypothetical protein
MADSAADGVLARYALISLAFWPSSARASSVRPWSRSATARAARGLLDHRFHDDLVGAGGAVRVARAEAGADRRIERLSRARLGRRMLSMVPSAGGENAE